VSVDAVDPKERHDTDEIASAILRAQVLWRVGEALAGEFPAILVSRLEKPDPAHELWPFCGFPASIAGGATSGKAIAQRSLGLFRMRCGAITAGRFSSIGPCQFSTHQPAHEAEIDRHERAHPSQTWTQIGHCSWLLTARRFAFKKGRSVTLGYSRRTNSEKTVGSYRQRRPIVSRPGA
jgi:hypothetical protein